MMKQNLYLTVVAVILATSQAQDLTCDMMVNPSLAPSDPLYQLITGSVTFTQDGTSNIRIDISLTGFNTTDGLSEHGFHVHTSGDVSSACEDAGGHFNPFSMDHGAPSATERHVGDLGNIMEDANGDVTTTIMDSIIAMDGDADITGRSIVIHETFDDLGLGGFPDSNTTGHAGARLACCKIAVSSSCDPRANYVVMVTTLAVLAIRALFM